MELSANTRLHGFTVRYAQPLPEIKATLYRMEHDKSGADLIWLDREDDNKTFAIAFKTIPQDDTGVFHILEHSVLCGSEKYPTREPFVELIKSSLQTFLNALTFSDKTMYPLSSRNDQDFLNLMDVYLDAVLHPLSATDPHAYRQEGWHYELDSPEGELTCNGVVYNEMKGAFADPDSVLNFARNRLLFPDNCYAFESGGHPDHITELTYENYQASHARFYHPSNARIVLDGSVDIDRALAKLDEYLGEYDRIEVNADIPMQAPVAPAELEVPYEIGPEEDPSNKVILSGGWVACTYEDKETIMACNALAEALCGSNTAPLKKALLEKGLVQDVTLYCGDGQQQAIMGLTARNTTMENKDAVWQVVEDTLTNLADNGLDRQQLHAILNRLEFSTREKDYGGMPKGLIFAITSMDSWLYGGDPAQNLSYDKVFQALHAKVDEGWFEQLLRRVMLENPHRARLCMVPSKTLGEEKRQAEQARLAQVKAGWSDAEIRQVMERFQALRQRQEREDTPEELATLPVLALSDIPEQGPALRQQVTRLNGRTLLHQDLDTDGITYLDLHFNAADLTLDELSALPLLGTLLGKLATRTHTAAELRRLTEERLGRFSASGAVYAKGGQTTACTPSFTVSVAMLDHRKADAAELLAELLHTTRFDDAQAILDLLRQSRLGLEQGVSYSGNVFAAMRGAAYLSAKGAVEDALRGIGQLRWLQKAEKSYEQDGEALRNELAALCAKLFVADRVTLSLTGPMDEGWLTTVLNALPSGAVGAPVDYTPAQPVAEGFQIPAEVGYAARCSNLNRVDQPYNGVALVAAQLLTFGYLWNTIRVKGGAYGTGLTLREDGFAAFTSYRDPQCGQSLTSFNAAGEALRAVCDSGESLDRYIISTVGNLDPVLTPRMEGNRSAALYFGGRTGEDLQRLRREVLHTTAEDLRSFSQVLDRLCADSIVCVIGGQAALDGCGDRLQRREALQ